MKIVRASALALLSLALATLVKRKKVLDNKKDGAGEPIGALGDLLE